MQTADRIERVAPEPLSKLETRRTGVAFLCLIVATNFVPWMQLAEASFDFLRPPSASESSMAVLGCLIAVVLVIASWLLGRRVPVESDRLIAKARDTGLLLALLTVGANLALAYVLRRRAFGRSFAVELKWFAPLWFGLVLPAELAAGFFKGRASIPIPRPLPSAPTLIDAVER
jgi:cytochrome bd-type quinol oxidase subunit 2